MAVIRRWADLHSDHNTQLQPLSFALAQSITVSAYLFVTIIIIIILPSII